LYSLFSSTITAMCDTGPGVLDAVEVAGVDDCAVRLCEACVAGAPPPHPASDVISSTVATHRMPPGIRGVMPRSIPVDAIGWM
jgi:hypothetical protein